MSAFVINCRQPMFSDILAYAAASLGCSLATSCFKASLQADQVLEWTRERSSQFANTQEPPLRLPYEALHLEQAPT